MVTVSIIVVSWNTKEILRDCLNSIDGETGTINHEVIVIDNASTDGTQEMIRNDFSWVKLIANGNNRGFAAANNQGLEIAEGRYFLLLNSDTIVLDHALSKTFEYARRHPDAGVIGCRILNADYSLQPSCSMYPSLLNNFILISGLYRVFPESRFWGRAEMTWWDYQSEKEIEVAKGCFMWVNREAYEEVGGMDEQFFMYSEEVDWCYRFKKEGWKLLFHPDAQIIHLGGASAAQLGGKRALIKDRSTIRYMRKHWTATRFRFGLVSMVLFYVSRLPIVCLLSIITTKSKYRKTLKNHWVGLRGLILWKSVQKS